MFRLLAMLVLSGIAAQAQTITETFGSGANQFTIDFVEIGNPGNAADTLGVGSVAYNYNLGKYEVNRDMVFKANTSGSLEITMADMSSYRADGGNWPVTGVTWYEAAQFVNWLNTSTGGAAAYKFQGGAFHLWSAGDAGYNANNPFRNSLAKYWIPSADEWYKGAYGKPDGSWSAYPSESGGTPISVSEGIQPNTAVYSQSSPAQITRAGGLSAMGTMGQGGNVWEWTETAIDGNNDTAGENREVRGGSWLGNNIFLYSETKNTADPTFETSVYGFRVAMVPEPTSFLLLMMGGAVLMVRRRKS